MQAQQVDPQELQYLISVSTGFIDTYVIDCFGREPMLLPQNIVLSAQNIVLPVKTVLWHQIPLPIYAVNTPSLNEGVALIIEGNETQQRFALLCDRMPQSMRLRISAVVDEEVESNTDPIVFQYISSQGKRYFIPHLDAIQKQL